MATLTLVEAAAVAEGIITADPNLTAVTLETIHGEMTITLADAVALQEDGPDESVTFGCCDHCNHDNGPVAHFTACAAGCEVESHVTVLAPAA